MTDKLLCITFSHHIFLNRDKRYQFCEQEEAEIETVGTNIAVWCRTAIRASKPVVVTDEPSQEIVCRYILSSKPSERIIEILDDGYQIFIPQTSARQQLLDKKHRGDKSLTFQHYSDVEIGGRIYRAVHFVIIKDEDELLDTLSN